MWAAECAQRTAAGQATARHPLPSPAIPATFRHTQLLHLLYRTLCAQQMMLPAKAIGLPWRWQRHPKCMSLFTPHRVHAYVPCRQGTSRCSPPRLHTVSLHAWPPHSACGTISHTIRMSTCCMARFSSDVCITLLWNAWHAQGFTHLQGRVWQ